MLLYSLSLSLSALNAADRRGEFCLFVVLRAIHLFVYVFFRPQRNTVSARVDSSCFENKKGDERISSDKKSAAAAANRLVLSVLFSRSVAIIAATTTQLTSGSCLTQRELDGRHTGIRLRLCPSVCVCVTLTPIRRPRRVGVAAAFSLRHRRRRRRRQQQQQQ